MSLDDQCTLAGEESPVSQGGVSASDTTTSTLSGAIDSNAEMARPPEFDAVFTNVSTGLQVGGLAPATQPNELWAQCTPEQQQEVILLHKDPRDVGLRQRVRTMISQLLTARRLGASMKLS
ncbi:hypothetical protein FJZ27_02825 [Candidatus Peribacteria bacterium]|nr:hypothetical protein [Candidatus Peribacteria bacterium]